MSKFAKVLVTIGAIFIYILIAVPITAGMKESGHSSGIVGLILLVALLGALKAIWSKPKDDNNDKDNTDNNHSVLQK